jgi:putative CocE/NonD family hydrolase
MTMSADFLSWADRIPWRRGETPLARTPAYEDSAFKLFFENDDYNAFWRQPGLAMDEYFEAFPDMPILWVGGWYDWYPRSISDGYQAMTKLRRRNQHLLIGAWTHDNGTHDNVLGDAGDAHFGCGDGELRCGDDFEQLQVRWFDRWLKGERDVDVGRPVSIFVMGGGDGSRREGRVNHGGRWLYPSAWPPAESRPTEFYLHAGGGLTTEMPAAVHSATSYKHDPRNTVSSNTRCFIPFPAMPTVQCRGGPHDQVDLATLPGHGAPGKPLASRPDVLVFQTPPLDADLTIAGDIELTLHLSSDAPDTDFFVKLIDVIPATADYPEGFALQLADGVLRARYRQGFARPALLEPGEIYRVTIPLEPSANRFQQGHRIRVDICSSNFPSYDINRNTADPRQRDSRIATNAVWHDAAHPSCIMLPVWKPAAQ